MKEKWTKEVYKEFIRDIQDGLDEDDNIRHISSDLLDTMDGLEKYIIEELNELNPLERLMKDLY